MNLVVSHWSANVAVLPACAAVVAVHLRGLRAASRAGAGQRRQQPGPRPGVAGAAVQAAAFYCGLGALVLALVSPLAYWAHRYIWVRSVQDVLLAVAAPGLLVLGAPWLPLARGIGGVPRRHWAGEAQAGSRAPAARSRPPQGRPEAPGTRGGANLTVRAWLTSPIAVTVAFNAAWWAWHMPALYDAATRHPVVQAAEVAAYLGLGVVLWLQLIGSRPFTPRLAPLSRVMLVVGTLVPGTVLAMVLIFGSGLLYPAYASASHHVFGVVADQQVGGAVLWAASLPPFFITTVALVLRWLNEEEAEALTAGFERLLKPPKRAWPSRPSLR